jgi:Tol biopolymer transport system component
LTTLSWWRTHWILPGIALLAGAAGLGALAVWSARREAVGPPSQRSIAQLTFEPGSASASAWSPDGRSIAFASDRSGDLDIWIQSIGGGEPRRVTDAPSADDQPSWSPDGSTIAFRSDRDGGGVFLVPASGGAVRRVAAFGYRPSWSPDGSQLLVVSSVLELVNESPKAYLVTPTGSAPREILAGLLPEFRRPHLAWHPDGRRVSIWGSHRRLGWSFWTVPPDDASKAVASEVTPQVREDLNRAAISFQSFTWSPGGRDLYFTGESKGTSSVWRIGVEGDGLRWTSGPERLTTGPGVNRDVAVSRDGKHLAFVIQDERTRLWAYPFDPVRGTIHGTATPLTNPGANAWSPDISRDGSHLAYRFVRGTRDELWQQSLETKEDELLVAGEGYPILDPHWSPDKTMVVYRRGGLKVPAGQDDQAIALLTRARQEERLLTTPGSGSTAQDWSPDGASILGRCAADLRELSRLCLFDVDAAPQAERSMRVIAADPQANLWQGRFSPDGRWVAFNMIRPAEAEISTIYVVGATGGPLTRITEGKWFDDKARWAPDGRTIYFVSNRSTSLNVWGRRFNPARGQPEGEPFLVTNLGSSEQMLLPRMGPLGMAVSKDRLIVPVTSLSGNVWTLDTPGR